MTDAAIARQALAALSDAPATLEAIAARLDGLSLGNADEARNGWEDAWLEFGIATVRVECAAETARRRGSTASASPDDRDWLAGQLASRDAAWDERQAAVADRLERVGLRIRALGARALPAATPPAPSAGAERQLVAVPMTRTLAPVPVEPVREAASVSAPPRPVAPQAAQAPAAPAITSWPPRRSTGADAPSPVVPVGAPTTAAPSPRSGPAPGVRPARAELPAARVVAALRSMHPEAAGPAALARAPSTPATPFPEVAREPDRLPEPRAAGTRRPAGRTIVLLFVLLASIGAVLAAVAANGRLGDSARSDPNAANADAPAGESGSDESRAIASTPADVPVAASSRTGVRAAAVTFDGAPLGPLEADATGVARVLGTVEVAAMPSPFDRSLLIAHHGSGACLDGVPGEPVRSLDIDVRTGDRVGSTLRITPADRPDGTAALVLSRIGGLRPATWYEVRLAWASGDPISFEIREREGGRAVQRGTLTAESSDDPGSGSVCIVAVDVSQTTAVHIDNAVVGS